jgi:hypothetical protein
VLCSTLPPAALAEPAESSPPAGEPGAVLRIEGWSVTPRNADLDFAFVDENANLSGGGEVQTLGHESEGVGRFYAGWRLGTPSDAEVGARFWEYDGTAFAETGELTEQVGALLATPDFAIGRSLVDSAEAQSRLRATSVDAVFTWNQGSRGAARVSWSVGLRLFRYEEAATVTYRAERFDELLEEFVNTSTDAQGVGPLLGVAFDHGFGRRVRLGGSLAVAVPVGDLEGLATDTALIDGEFDQASVVDRDESRAFVHLEGRLGVDFLLGRGWTLSLAYALEQWSGTRLELRFVDEFSSNSAVSDEADALFEGGLLGLRYDF